MISSAESWHYEGVGYRFVAVKHEQWLVSTATFTRTETECTLGVFE